MEVAQSLKPIAEKYGKSVSQLAVNWVLENPIVSTAIIGPRTIEQYEDNIGILTPIVADELREAESHYPISWIDEAFKEAVTQNKRSWRYVSRILERWDREGRHHGKSGRYPKKTGRY